MLEKFRTIGPGVIGCIFSTCLNGSDAHTDPCRNIRSLATSESEIEPVLTRFEVKELSVNKENSPHVVREWWDSLMQNLNKSGKSHISEKLAPYKWEVITDYIRYASAISLRLGPKWHSDYSIAVTEVWISDSRVVFEMTSDCKTPFPISMTGRYFIDSSAEAVVAKQEKLGDRKWVGFDMQSMVSKLKYLPKGSFFDWKVNDTTVTFELSFNLDK